MKDPKIYLGIDNCFASKRWTEPMEWANVIRNLGVYYVEASADTECDPLYMGKEYLDDWCVKVNKAREATGVMVKNFYSGHGTYATLGLAHTDKRVRERFLKEWLMPMAKTAKKAEAGLGFFCHAFSDSVLQNPKSYSEAYDNLIKDLAALAKFSEELGLQYIGVEQMYSPHQVPWTVSGARKMIKDIYAIGKAPCYITIDTGHQSGQYKFTRPTDLDLELMFKEKINGNYITKWLGPESAYRLFDGYTKLGENELKELNKEFDRYPYLFAEKEDSDTYRWLSELGDMSPIIHLQQTDGVSSFHWPFTPEYNKAGKIKGDEVLKAIFKAYSKECDEEMPVQCDEITLTIEMFTGTAQLNRDSLAKLRSTVEYWRNYIPTDGMRLSELIERL